VTQREQARGNLSAYEMCLDACLSAAAASSHTVQTASIQSILDQHRHFNADIFSAQ